MGGTQKLRAIAENGSAHQRSYLVDMFFLISHLCSVVPCKTAPFNKNDVHVYFSCPLDDRYFLPLMVGR
jgi:hypothetical protein